MQWEEVQINIELTLNVSEKIEKATTENLESSLGWSDFPKHHAIKFETTLLFRVFILYIRINHCIYCSILCIFLVSFSMDQPD